MFLLKVFFGLRVCSANTPPKPTLTVLILKENEFLRNMAFKKQHFCLLQMPNPYKKKLHFIYKKEKKKMF